MHENIKYKVNSEFLNPHTGRSAFSDFVQVIDCDIEEHKLKIVMLQSPDIS